MSKVSILLSLSPSTPFMCLCVSFFLFSLLHSVALTPLTHGITRMKDVNRRRGLVSGEGSMFLVFLKGFNCPPGDEKVFKNYFVEVCGCCVYALGMTA